METQKKSINWIAVITMMFLCGMIGFVTYLGQPLSDAWKAEEAIKNSTILAVLGNAMVFVAYLFMGIPSGKLLSKIGYKKTALLGIAAGFVAMTVQMFSGKMVTAGESIVFPYSVYLVGGLIGGVSACLLNMVVNPMLNLLGGGGKRGNQLNLAGMTFNSLATTFTPIIAGMVVAAAAKPSMADCAPLMYVAMAVFAVSFAIIAMVKIQDPEQAVVTEKIGAFSPLKFRHCLLGVVAIFAYMGVEAGIPGLMKQWLSTQGKSIADAANSVAAVYFFLMFVGRLIGAAIGGKVSSRVMMIFTSLVAVFFILIGTQTTGLIIKMPGLTIGDSVSIEMVSVPLAALFFALCGLCASVMWPAIFNLATEKLGKYTAAASGLFMMMVAGGGVFQVVQALLIDSGVSYMTSFVVPALALTYIFIYAAFFSKPQANIEEAVK